MHGLKKKCMRALGEYKLKIQGAIVLTKFENNSNTPYFLSFFDIVLSH